MTKAEYQCLIVGDGKTPETAFRPAIADVKDANGKCAYSYSVSIPTDKNGVPIGLTCTVIAEGDPALVAASADIVMVAADVI